MVVDEEDGLYVLLQDWVNVAFHCYFLWLLYGGFKACGVLKTAIAELDAQVEEAPRL